jgi:hypothetical protein
VRGISELRNCDHTEVDRIRFLGGFWQNDKFVPWHSITWIEYVRDLQGATGAGKEK